VEKFVAGFQSAVPLTYFTIALNVVVVHENLRDNEKKTSEKEMEQRTINCLV
jgi:hypothetical protein